MVATLEMHAWVGDEAEETRGAWPGRGKPEQEGGKLELACGRGLSTASSGAAV